MPAQTRSNPELQANEQFQPPTRRAFDPVNTLVEAAPATQINPMAQLADALKGVNPKLQSFLEDENTKASVEDIEAGKAQALQQALTYKEAVDRGIIPATASPYFVMGYKEQSGRIQGQNAIASMNADWQKWDGRNSDDPNAIQQFTSSAVSKAMQGVDDSFIRAGMLPEIQAGVTNLQKHHAAYTNDRVYQTTLNDFGTLVGNAVQASMQAAAAQGKLPDIAALHQEITALSGTPKFIGVSPKDVDHILKTTVAAQAEMIGGEQGASLMGVLNLDRPDAANPGKTVPGPGRTAEGRKLAETVYQNITAQMRAKASFQWSLEDHARKAGTLDFQKTVIDGLSKDPVGFNPDPKALQDASRINPDIPGWIAEQRKKIRDGQDLTPPHAAAQMLDLYNGMNRMTEADFAKRIQAFSTQDQQRMMDDFRTARKDGSVVQTPQFQMVTKMITGDASQGIIPMFKDSALGLSVANNAYSEALKFERDHPNASPIEKSEFTTKMSERIQKQATLFKAGGGNLTQEQRGEGAPAKAAGTAPTAPVKPSALPGSKAPKSTAAPAAENPPSTATPPVGAPLAGQPVPGEMAAALKSGVVTQQYLDSLYGEGVSAQILNQK